MTENSNSIQQEIAKLEQQLTEKRANLEQQSAETDKEVPHDKEILKQVVGEKIQEHLSAQAGAPTYIPQAKSQQKDDATQSYTDPDLKDKVQELVNLAFNKSLEEGIREATKSNNFALIDAFHDVLVDQLYDALIERRKLEAVK